MNPDASTTDPLAELQRLLSRISAAIDDPQSPLRNPVIATADADGLPHARTVILRSISQNPLKLTFFTDVRSPKVKQLTARPRVVWCFYEPVERVQLRLDALAEVHHQNDLATQQWAKVPQEARRNYRTAQPPGAVIAADSAPELSAGDGYDHFAVVCCPAIEADLLLLRREGNLRFRVAFADGPQSAPGQQVIRITPITP